MFVVLLCVFIAALCSPVWKGLKLWLSFVMFNCVLSIFHVCGILGHVRNKIVSFPDLGSFLTLMIHMGLEARNPVLGGLRTTNRRPACASVQSDQRLCYSLFGKHHM